jgi:hypothetical protein
VEQLFISNGQGVEIIAQVDLHGKLLVIKKIKWGSTLIFFNNLREKLAEKIS